jgi:hypothetical protein
MKNLRTKLSTVAAMLLLTAAAATAQTEIRTAEDMTAIGNDKDSKKGSYILMNDLTLENWTPVGDFNGTFNGNGHTITLIYAEQAKSAETLELAGTAFVGLFRFIDRKGLVMNLHVTGSIVITNDKKAFRTIALGGIAGCNLGKIANCRSSVSLKGESTEQESIPSPVPYGRSLSAGGIAGINGGEIVNCYATGDIEVSGDCHRIGGGIVGGNGYSHRQELGGDINCCYATGAISVHDDKKSHIAGGIAGRNVESKLVNCVALNSRIDVTGTSKKNAIQFDYVNNAANGLFGDHYNYGNRRVVKSKNSYYRSDMVINMGISSNVDKRKPEGVAVDPTATQQREWWENSPKFAFGQTDEAPWIWDETQQRPVLYWEKLNEDL